uniref:aggregation-promoting factor C-terminal-like domain-containing protein n=1 Tax=Nocardioides sp. SYSU DS0651 TaxID=3415955 RepID=UPI003F4C593F
DAARAAGSGDAAVAADRAPVLSRADRRPEADPAKAAGLAPSRTAALTDERKLSDSDPRDIARALLPDYGWGSEQFGCLDSLWTKESNWRWNADNPTSSAYGIPQSLPGSKMASAGADWATNPATQIKWGLGYIQDRYGSPCSAWGHSQAVNWY